MSGVAFKFDKEAPQEVKFQGEVKAPETKEAPESVTPPEQTPPVPEKEPEAPVTEPEVKEPETPATEPETPATEPKDVDDAQVLAFLNAKGKTTFLNLDEYNASLTKEVQVEKIIEKEPELDPLQKDFQNYKKNTGKGFADFMNLNRDFDKLSDLDMALDSIREKNKGLSLTDAQAKILLAEQVGADAIDDEMDEVSKLKLQVVANGHRQALKADKQKYINSEPSEVPTKTPDSPETGDKVMVNGQLIERATYDQQRKDYLSTNEKAVQAIDRDIFKFEVEGKSGKSTVDVGYVYTDEDKQAMLSTTESVDKIVSSFVSEDGQINHTELNKAVRWMDANFREKAITTMMQQARSAGVDEVIKKSNNIDFTPTSQPEKVDKKDEKYGEINPDFGTKGMRVKYPLIT